MEETRVLWRARLLNIEQDMRYLRESMFRLLERLNGSISLAAVNEEIQERREARWDTTGYNQQNNGRLLRRLELPIFNGHEPEAWIVGVERYFSINRLMKEEKLDAAVVCFEGPALLWLQWEQSCRPIFSWTELKSMVLARFRLAKEGSLCDQLFSLRQTADVDENPTLFEGLHAHLPRVPDETKDCSSNPDLGQSVTSLTTPGFNSFMSIDEYSHFESKDTKYCDSVQEQSSTANYSRDLTGSSGLVEKESKYRCIEGLSKYNVGCFIEPFNERSSSSKASSLEWVDRSPSSTNDDRRHMSRTGVRRSLDIGETGRRSASIDMRELPPSLEITTLQPILQHKNFEVSSSKDYSTGFPPNSFVLGGLNFSYTDETMVEPSSCVHVRMSTKFVDTLHSGDDLSEEESEIVLQADLSMGQGVEDTQQCSTVDEFVLTGTNQEATTVVDINKKDLSCRGNVEPAASMVQRFCTGGLSLGALRYAREIEGFGQVITLDNDNAPVDACRRNIKLKGSVACEKVESHFADARVYMLTHPKEFAVVDLDPYGSPSAFLDSAAQSVVDGGLLMCTASDMAEFCWGTGEVCYSKYDSYPLRGKYCHEMALQIPLACIESHPIGRTVSKNISVRYLPECSDCGKKFNMGGTMCSTLIHDQDWMTSILTYLKLIKDRYPAFDRITAVLTTISEELPDVPLFLSLHNLCATLTCTSPSAVIFRSDVINAGYHISRIHVNQLGLRSDAPMDVIWDIMPCWVKILTAKAEPADLPEVAKTLWGADMVSSKASKIVREIVILVVSQERTRSKLSEHTILSQIPISKEDLDPFLNLYADALVVRAAIGFRTEDGQEPVHRYVFDRGKQKTQLPLLNLEDKVDFRADGNDTLILSWKKGIG